MLSNLDYEHQQSIDHENIPVTLKNLMQIPQYPQKSDEWYAARKNFLTASNLDAVLGRNTYSSREEILFKKCGMSIPFEGNMYTKHGNDTEDLAIAEYCKMYNKKTIDFGLLPHPEVEFLAGSPDGIAFDNGNPDSKPLVLEVKCPFRKIIPGEIPRQYKNQIILNCVITGYDGVFIEYCPKGHIGKDYMLNIVHVKLADHIEQFNNHTLPVLREFWDEVLHYRKVGIETHPNYSIWERKCNPRKLKVMDIETPVSMFID
jgi:putative phage-type endonuclease